VLRPLFNEFTPLPEGSLRSEVLELAGRSGVEVGEVYRVDASRRTTAANAYVDGLGPTKRIVLYDNLVDELPPDQVRAVVAHELAHVEQRDILRGLAWLAIVALPGMLAVQRLSEVILMRRWGAAVPASPAALPAIALSLALVSFVAQLPANSLSRMVERRADARALALTREPDAFVDLQRDLAVRNIADPDPPAFLHDLLGTHPTTLERIGLGRAWARERPAAGNRPV
jgi:STE24 endopeptidase